MASVLDRLNVQPLQVLPEARQLHAAAAAAAADAAAEPRGLSIPPLEAWGEDPFLMACCERGAAPLRAAVLVSGGVDSSLALQLVAAAGHAATAFYLQIWFQEDFRNFWDACPWEEDLAYARAVCDALGVRLVVVPLTQAYWDRVVAHSVAEIKAGRTPNPDMLCNSRVKFGAFVEYLEREHGGSFDRIASGHYARVERAPQQQQQQQQQARQQHQQPPTPAADKASSSSSSSGMHGADSSSASLLDERRSSHALAGTRGSSSSGGSSDVGGAAVRLLMAPDAVKDQTYFLAGLSPAQLARCMFPLGGFTKPQVRALAAAAGLATSQRKDSQGICFLGKVKFGEFVREHLGEWPGPLVDEDSGQVVGVHEGYWFYTVGQRGGIKLPGGPWYVTRKDAAANVVRVSRSYYEQQQQGRRDAFVCGPCSWLAGPRAGAGPPSAAQPLLVKVRHGPSLHECRLVPLAGQREAAALLERGSAAAFGRSGAGEGSGAGASGSGAGASGSASGVLGQQQREREQQQQGQAAAGSDASGGSSSSAGGEYALVLLAGSDQGLAAGQYAVFYQDGQCLGSAQILGSVAGGAQADTGSMDDAAA